MLRLREFRRYLWQKESPLYLVAVRIFWAAVIFYEFEKMHRRNWSGLHERFYQHAFHMKYCYMEWIPDLPSEGTMHFMVYLWAVCAVLIALGLYYHEAMFTFLVLFSYHYFSTEENYLNHHWVIIVFTLSMTLLPAGNSFSLGAWKATGDWRGDKYVPRWVRWYLALHLDCVYIYGSVAKINVDWLRASPLYNWVWFSHTRTFAWLEPVYEWWAFPYIISYGGIVWDGIAPVLLRLPGWLRIPGLFGSMAFHGFNKHQFSIGVFPYMSMALSTLYFPANWPANVYRYTIGPLVYIVNAAHLMRSDYDNGHTTTEEEEEEEEETPKEEFIPRKSSKVRHRHTRNNEPPALSVTFVDPPERHTTVTDDHLFDGWIWRIVFALCLTIAVLQVALPVRNHMAPQNYTMSPAWSDEGHQFSWRMKLRDRDVSGKFYVAVHFLASNETIQYVYSSAANDHRPGRVELNGKVVERGMAQASPSSWRKFTSRPSALRRYALYLQQFTKEDYHLFNRLDVEVEVRGEFYASLNFRPSAKIISRDVPLCDPELSMWGKDWLEPEPYMPDTYQDQYPWVFIPMLLTGEDSPCAPWHGIQMTRKIEDSIDLVNYYSTMEKLYSKKTEREESKKEQYQAFEDYRASDRVALSERIVGMCADWNKSIDNGDCQHWAADSNSTHVAEAEAQRAALSYFIDLKRIIEEGWTLHGLEDRVDDSEDADLLQKKDVWKSISTLCYRWNKEEHECRSWATEVANNWIKARTACDDFYEHRDWLPAVWKDLHGGFRPRDS